MTLHNNLHEVSVINAQFLWFTDGFYLKGENGKYCAEYAILIPFKILEAAPLLLGKFYRDSPNILAESIAAGPFKFQIHPLWKSKTLTL